MVLRIVITGLRPGDSSMVGHEVLLNKLEVLTSKISRLVQSAAAVAFHSCSLLMPSVYTTTLGSFNEHENISPLVLEKVSLSQNGFLHLLVGTRRGPIRDTDGWSRPCNVDLAGRTEVLLYTMP